MRHRLLTILPLLLPRAPQAESLSTALEKRLSPLQSSAAPMPHSAFNSRSLEHATWESDEQGRLPTAMFSEMIHLETQNNAIYKANTELQQPDTVLQDTNRLESWLEGIKGLVTDDTEVETLRVDKGRPASDRCADDVGAKTDLNQVLASPDMLDQAQRRPSDGEQSMCHLPSSSLMTKQPIGAESTGGKRRRRRWDEIDRVYACATCPKSYGTRSHLNSHLRLTGHASPQGRSNGDRSRDSQGAAEAPIPASTADNGVAVLLIVPSADQYRAKSGQAASHSNQEVRSISPSCHLSPGQGRSMPSLWPMANTTSTYHSPLSSQPSQTEAESYTMAPIQPDPTAKSTSPSAFDALNLVSVPTQSAVASPVDWSTLLGSLSGQGCVELSDQPEDFGYFGHGLLEDHSLMQPSGSPSSEKQGFFLDMQGDNSLASPASPVVHDSNRPRTYDARSLHGDRLTALLQQLGYNHENLHHFAHLCKSSKEAR